MERNVCFVVWNMQTGCCIQFLECTSDEEQRSQGLDIADFFLYSPSKRQILHQMIQRNPALQLLIDELDLELIE